MFSSITMASSTTRPMASTMASRVRVLIEKPSAQITKQVPISETGMVTIGTVTARGERRKNRITASTSTAASIRVL